MEKNLAKNKYADRIERGESTMSQQESKVDLSFDHVKQINIIKEKLFAEEMIEEEKSSSQRKAFGYARNDIF